MTPPDLFEQGLIFFNSGKFYEAHESWEDLWRITSGPERRFYQGLIQAAVGLHHLSRNNTLGARGQLTKALSHLSNFSNAITPIDTANLIVQLREILEEMRPREVQIARLPRL